MMPQDLRMLIAEDNSADVILIEEALRDHGLKYSIRAFADGAEAASFLKSIERKDDSACPDVVLLDLNLPKVDGHQLLRIIREHSVCSNVPVIVVTSSDSAGDRQTAARLGATHYFRKPSSLEEFMKLGGIVKEVVWARER